MFTFLGLRWIWPPKSLRSCLRFTLNHKTFFDKYLILLQPDRNHHVTYLYCACLYTYLSLRIRREELLWLLSLQHWGQRLFCPPWYSHCLKLYWFCSKAPKTNVSLNWGHIAHVLILYLRPYSPNVSLKSPFNSEGRHGFWRKEQVNKAADDTFVWRKNKKSHYWWWVHLRHGQVNQENWTLWTSQWGCPGHYCLMRYLFVCLFVQSFTFR